MAGHRPRHTTGPLSGSHPRVVRCRGSSHFLRTSNFPLLLLLLLLRNLTQTGTAQATELRSSESTGCVGRQGESLPAARWGLLLFVYSGGGNRGTANNQQNTVFWGGGYLYSAPPRRFHLWPSFPAGLILLLLLLVMLLLILFMFLLLLSLLLPSHGASTRTSPSPR